MEGESTFSRRQSCGAAWECIRWEWWPATLLTLNSFRKAFFPAAFPPTTRSSNVAAFWRNIVLLRTERGCNGMVLPFEMMEMWLSKWCSNVWCVLLDETGEIRPAARDVTQGFAHESLSLLHPYIKLTSREQIGDTRYVVISCRPTFYSLQAVIQFDI